MKKPSISELIKLLDKPALIGWANREGLKGVDISKKRKEWRSYGTSLHSQIYNFITNGEKLIKSEDQKNLEKFLKNIEVISVECKVENEYFTGVYDLMYRKNGKTYLGDYKSNAKRIYFEHKLQIAGYAMCVEADAYSVISIPTFSEMSFMLNDIDNYHEILKSLSNIYNQKQIIDGKF